MNTVHSKLHPHIRPSAVAGLFYPAKAAELEHILAEQFRHARPTDEHQQQPKALIVPHAGYIYSGSIAATAYQLLQAFKNIHRVVLVGPSHRYPFHGVAVSEADYFATPLGDIPVDTDQVETLLSIEGVQRMDQAHANEHSLEVQLPFLQYVLDDFSIVPVVTGDADPQLVANVIELSANDPDTLVVISSDLSHYLDYDSAQAIDRLTSQAIISLDINDIDSFHACGCVGIRGFLLYARQQQLSGALLDLRNSGDTAGRKDSVVGYGAYLFA